MVVVLSLRSANVWSGGAQGQQKWAPLGSEQFLLPI